MAEFLDLCGEGPAAAFLDPRDEPAADSPDHGEKKPVPLDGRVVLRFLPVQQIAVLDEQQASGDEVRYRSKIPVDPFRELGGIDLVAGAIGNPDAGLVLLGGDRERAEPDKAKQTLRPARLLADLEVVFVQGGDELRQLDIAEPFVVRPAFREMDRIARPALDTEAHPAIEAGEGHRLQV